MPSERPPTSEEAASSSKKPPPPDSPPTPEAADAPEASMPDDVVRAEVHALAAILRLPNPSEE